MAIAAGTAIGAPIDRLEGAEKVAGAAKYAYEYEVERAAYAVGVCSAIAKGRVRTIDAADALAAGGVLAVLSYENAPKLHEQLDDGELMLFQSDRISYRGQLVAVAIAESLEAAQEAERLLRVEYEVEQHDVELRADHPRLYKPDKVNPQFPTDTFDGAFDDAFAGAPVQVDRTYETPAYHNNPLEPHTTAASWQGDAVTLWDSNQGVQPVVETVAKAFGLEQDRVRVISPHVGGGFGSKGTPRPNVIAAIMASQLVARPVKLAVTRQQMFAFVGYRTPTIQRLRLGAEPDGTLVAIAHDVWEQTSTVREFAEQTAVVTRMMYAAPHRRTTHRLVALDVPTPSWLRAPGECPGMYALESAIDELAVELALDPIELRVRNEPEIDPESGQRFSSRNVVACLREGAERFGWSERRGPRECQEGRWLVGLGVAASTYPARRRPSQALARAEADGTFTVRLRAADIGTGARTALAQIGADTLEVPVERVRLELGDSEFPQAPLAGGSMGLASWGSAIVKACRALRVADGNEVRVDTSDDVAGDPPLAKYGFGAQFVEARVDVDTGEVRIPRALGVFACGTIVNPKTARSQFLGGMTMGISMALHEESVLDPRFGDFVNHDLAQYEIATHADVRELDAIWLEEDDPHVNPMGAKGIGEIGIVGTAAAVTSAIHNATGVRIRKLPVRLEQLLAAESAPLAGHSAPK